MDKHTHTIHMTYYDDNTINIDTFINKLYTIYNEYNDIYNTGYIERVKNNIQLLECFKNCIIDYDMIINVKNNYDILSYDIINGVTGEIICIMD